MSAGATEVARDAAATAAALALRWRDSDAEAIVAAALRGALPGRVALVSSFGAEAAVLLHMVAAVDRATPVLLLDTGKHFGATLDYRDTLAAHLGLLDLRTLRPDAAALADRDPDGDLVIADPDACCRLRKVEPLERGLRGFAAWLSGRRREHGGDRARIAVAEAQDGRVKVNPLAAWTDSDVAAYLDRHSLPRHPLHGQGFLSIGCEPCTDIARPGETARAGRWRGRAKTECGIHQAALATIDRT